MSNSPVFVFNAPLSDKITELKSYIESLKQDIYVQIQSPDDCRALQTIKLNFLQYLLYKANTELAELEMQYQRQSNSTNN